MKHILAILIGCWAILGCDNEEAPLAEEEYLEFCVMVQDEFNAGSYSLSQFFDLKVFASKVAGQMSSEGLPTRNIGNSEVFGPYIDTFNMNTTALIFNKLYQSKTGDTYGVFYADLNGGRNYWDVQLVHHQGEIAIADFYDYGAGAYLSEIIGQDMALANSYKKSRNGNFSYDPSSIASNIITHIANQDIESAWASYGELSNDDKKKKLFEFLRIQLAMAGNDSIYFDVVDNMLLEKKRDPRFFYLHRSNYFMLKREYATVVEQLVKLHEYTGKGYFEINELAIYSALAGKYEEAINGTNELLELLPEEPLPYLQRIAIYYLMDDKAKFDKSLADAEDSYSMTGDDLWAEIMEECPYVVSLSQFDSLKTWVVTNNTLN